MTKTLDKDLGRLAGIEVLRSLETGSDGEILLLIVPTEKGRTK